MLSDKARARVCERLDVKVKERARQRTFVDVFWVPEWTANCSKGEVICGAEKGSRKAVFVLFSHFLQNSFIFGHFCIFHRVQKFVFPMKILRPVYPPGKIAI